MNDREIWKYCREKSVKIIHPLEKDFVWIKKEDFEEVKKYFQEEKGNPFQRGYASSRTRSWLRHLHAVEKNEQVCVHYDTGNPVRFAPLAIIHLFVDVLPFLIYCLFVGKRPGDILK